MHYFQLNGIQINGFMDKLSINYQLYKIIYGFI